MGCAGTGSVGIELAKAWGAKHIATATTGSAGIAFVRSLGATFVTDYKQQDLFDALPENSVDIVCEKLPSFLLSLSLSIFGIHGQYIDIALSVPPCVSDDNYAADGTADKAMRAIRPGGMYLMMPHVSPAAPPPLIVRSFKPLLFCRASATRRRCRRRRASPPTLNQAYASSTTTLVPPHRYFADRGRPSSARLTGPFMWQAPISRSTPAPGWSV